jgi:cold shock CspA family protein
MGRSQESFNKKEIRKKKEKKRQEKEKKKQARKDSDSKSGLDDMIAYVDENGMITSTPPEPGVKKKTKAEDIEVSVPKQTGTRRNDPVRFGQVTFFNDSKGYGFIEDSDNRQSVFVHASEFQDDISEGDEVTFEIEQGPRGAAAVRVKLT